MLRKGNVPISEHCCRICVLRTRWSLPFFSGGATEFDFSTESSLTTSLRTCRCSHQCSHTQICGANNNCRTKTTRSHTKICGANKNCRTGTTTLKTPRWSNQCSLNYLAKGRRGMKMFCESDTLVLCCLTFWWTVSNGMPDYVPKSGQPRRRTTKETDLAAIGLT